MVIHYAGQWQRRMMSSSQRQYLFGGLNKMRMQAMKIFEQQNFQRQKIVVTKHLGWEREWLVQRSSRPKLSEINNNFKKRTGSSMRTPLSCHLGSNLDLSLWEGPHGGAWSQQRGLMDIPAQKLRDPLFPKELLTESRMWTRQWGPERKISPAQLECSKGAFSSICRMPVPASPCSNPSQGGIVLGWRSAHLQLGLVRGPIHWEPVDSVIGLPWSLVRGHTKWGPPALKVWSAKLGLFIYLYYY